MGSYITFAPTFKGCVMKVKEMIKGEIIKTALVLPHAFTLFLCGRGILLNLLDLSFIL
jgi:hypothetical protein